MAEYVKALVDLDWRGVLDAWAQCAHTIRGAARIQTDRPFVNREDAETRSEAVAEARILSVRGAPMPFSGIFDPEDSLSHLARGGVLEAAELIELGQTLASITKLQSHLRMHRSQVPRLASRCSDMSDFLPLSQTLLEAFNEQGELADHASPALGTLRNEVKKTKGRIETRSSEIMTSEEWADSLQDSFWTIRDERYVLPIRVSDKTKNRGIVHGTSQSGQTAFVEPAEIVSLNNALRLAESKVKSEERRIYAELTGRVRQLSPEIGSAMKSVTELDLIAAASHFAEKTQSTPIIFSSNRTLCLKNARHPLMVLSDKACIANTVHFIDTKVLVISGPNAGGKTVVMKVVGTLALMAQCGLHLPASAGSTLPWFDQILTCIGDAQSIANELSTFSAHLLMLKDVLSKCGSGSLVLIDELCGATSPVQGGALAHAFLESLGVKECVALVTTHYDSLKVLAAEDSTFANASMGFDAHSLTPTYLLHVGTPGASAALDLARRLGLPGSLLERADQLLGDDVASVEKLLSDIAEQRDALERERASLARAESELESAKDEIRALTENVEERVHRKHVRLHGDAMDALKAARLAIDASKDALKNRRHVDIRQLERNVDKNSARIRQHAPKTSSDERAALAQSQIKVGASAWVKALGGSSEIIEIKHDRRALVARGMLKSVVSFDDLKVADKKAPSQTAKIWRTQKRPSSESRAQRDAPPAEAPFQSAEITLDIRGERVDAGIDALDRYLDQSILAAREAIFVIHGHGTGALRRGIREALSDHPSVESFRPGESGEGGDGVTLVWLR